MVSSVRYQLSQGSPPTKPTGIVKRPSKPKARLRSHNKFFWFTDSDGVIRLATSTDPNIIPMQTNNYDFNPSDFFNQPYPSTFPPGSVWPPEKPADVVCSISKQLITACVGEKCYTDKTCIKASCSHTLEKWKKATRNWEDYFELRMTDSRGIGVFTKRAFDADTVLGWYSGELKTYETCEDSDYLMEIEIGDNLYDSDDKSPRDSVYIDSERNGNWTRFINHSCDPHALFSIRRVGNVMIMAVETVKDVAEGVELTVSYGDCYYGLDTKRICGCETVNCVGRDRREATGVKRSKVKKAKVKKCKRLEP